MDHPRRTGGCIYCGSSGPFSDEHVVPAGLGGDDAGWLLSGCVCRLCNTGIFSKLETKFLRSSPVAIYRLFQQEKTRNRGTRTGAPSVQAKVTLYSDPETGVQLAAEIGPQGRVRVLPQIVVIPQKGQVKTTVTGPEREALSSFLGRLAASLDDSVMLIEKLKNGNTVSFPVTVLRWNNETYSVEQTSVASRPPKEGMWVEAALRSQTARQNEQLPLSVFELSGGQLVCRAESPRATANLLTFLRLNPQLMTTEQVEAVTTSDKRPNVHLCLEIDINACNRVLTKIGLNLVAKVLGDEFVREPAFDAAVAYVREGAGSVCTSHVPSNPLLEHFFEDRHVMGLFAIPNPCGNCLILRVQLFGGPVQQFQLAEFSKPILGLADAVVIHVNYHLHKIERLSLPQYVMTLTPEQSQ